MATEMSTVELYARLGRLYLEIKMEGCERSAIASVMQQFDVLLAATAIDDNLPFDEGFQALDRVCRVFERMSEGAARPWRKRIDRAQRMLEDARYTSMGVIML